MLLSCDTLGKSPGGRVQQHHYDFVRQSNPAYVCAGERRWRAGNA